MPRYPVSVPRESYGGSNPQKREKNREYNRIAEKVEKHINDYMRDLPENASHMFTSGSVAIDLREDSKVVQRIIFSIDCGHNGVTVFKGDFNAAWRNPA